MVELTSKWLSASLGGAEQTGGELKENQDTLKPSRRKVREEGMWEGWREGGEKRG